MNADEKICPFCLETIKAGALRCKHCPADLTAIPSSNPPPSVNLVLFESGESSNGRYRLLETVRQYARDRLMESGEGNTVRCRHRDCFLALAEQAARDVPLSPERSWREPVQAEYDNLRAALEWCLADSNGTQAGLHLAAALSHYWEVVQAWSEGREQFQAALSRPGAEARTLPRAHALQRSAVLARYQGDYRSAHAAVEEALAIFRERGDRTGEATILLDTAWAAWIQGEFSRARALGEQALAICRETGDRVGEAYSLHTLGRVADMEKDYPVAQKLLDQSVRMCREIGHRRQEAWGLVCLGFVAQNQEDFPGAHAFMEQAQVLSREIGYPLLESASIANRAMLAKDQGDLLAARSFLEQALSITREIGDRRGQGFNLDALGRVATEQGDYEEAGQLLREALEIRRDLEQIPVIVATLANLAFLAAQQDDPRRAARLYAASQALNERMDVTAHGEKQAAEVDPVRMALGEPAFAAAWAEGRTMTMEQAIAYALDTAPG